MKNLSTKPENVRRRARYVADKEYRTKVIVRRRKAYAKVAKQANPHSLSTKAVESRIAKLGRHFLVPEGRNARYKLVTLYAVCDIAKALGFTPVAVYSWVKAGKIPPPTAAAGKIKGYTYSQFVKIVYTLADHFRSVSHLRREHTDTINTLFRIVNY